MGEDITSSPNYFAGDIKEIDFWYVYELIDPRDDKVFYVGKGCRDRISSHEKEAAKGKSSKKCNKIREIWMSNSHPKRNKVAIFWDENAAYDHETDRIEFYGLENLTNVLPGGQKAWTRRIEEREQRRNKNKTPTEKQFLGVCLGLYLLTRGFRQNLVCHIGNHSKEIPLSTFDFIKDEFFIFLNNRRGWVIKTAQELGYTLKISGKNLCLTSGHKN